MSDTSKKQKAGDGKKRVSTLGDFQLKKRLGKGGMGEVFLAQQISLDRMVALKTLSRSLSKREDFVKRFIREARSMARLDHPNVVKVYAVDSDKGVHFAAIEYIDGKSVQDWLNKLGRMSVGDALHIAIVCAEGLLHAHEKDMVHRDIKPDNILVTSKGVVKVADFGLAKALDEDVSMTQSGTGLGTPLYMAPEQARDAKHVDHRCDIYALGATLYHLVTGELPFMGTTALELIMAKEKGSFTAARKLNPEVPERLDLMMDKMLAKEPSHRYRNCTEIIKDLTSLGIHNNALSFIGGALPMGAAGPSSLAAMPGTAGSGAGAAITIPPKAESGAAKSGSKGKIKPRKSVSGAPMSGIWFVQYSDKNGKPIIDKLPTKRILKLIAAGLITAKARAKTSAEGEYMPLAQFPEFADAIEKQLQEQSVALRKQDMNSLYKQVEKAEKNRLRWRWLSNLTRNTVGWISLAMWLGLIAVVVAGGYFAVRTWGPDFLDYIGVNAEGTGGGGAGSGNFDKEDAGLDD